LPTSETPRPPDAGQGRIGLTVRVGVTGHRHLKNVEVLSATLEEALDRLVAALDVEASPNTTVNLHVLSALAEGADRLVAEALIARGANLEVVLPLEPQDYASDFHSLESQAEFARLRGKAERETVMVPAPDRKEAYFACGKQIVDRSDVLVALWDGQRARGKGGTGDIVAYAQERHVPIIWLSTEGHRRVEPLIGEDIVVWSAISPLEPEARQQLDRYNTAEYRPDRLAAAAGQLAQATTSGVRGLQVAEAVEWSAPFFARAELEANFYERLYKWAGVSLFALSFLAVLIVTGQELFSPNRPWIVWFEVLLLAATFVGIFYARRVHLHERWITARYLGESFRSALFLALAGIGDVGGEGLIRVAEDDPTDAWLRRAFAEVWALRPMVKRTEADVGPLQRFLGESWLEDQVQYYSRTANRHEMMHRRLANLAYFFFAVSATAAVLHSLDVGRASGRTFAWWGFFSIVVPAAAAAVSGLGAQREYQQHAKRYGRMARQITDLRVRVEGAEDLASLQQLVLEADRRMRAETGEWFGVVRLHALELPA
jgi:SMODS and SLOG-associating 2TM effector domain 1